MIYFLLIVVLLINNCDSAWKLAGSKIKTRWASKVDPSNVWPEYPRPQLVRSNWTNLNGLWNYAIVKSTDPKPTKFDGEILVPFAVESSISGVQQMLQSSQALWYERTFKTPSLSDSLLILNFGAVDYESEIYVNGKHVGEHKGGYDSFSFDITNYLTDNSADQTITLKVLDATGGAQPRGKQTSKPESIWYTPTSGIWQTVWLERVPKTHIESLRIVPNVDKSSVSITVNTNTPNTHSAIVEIKVLDSDKKVVGSASKANTNAVIDISVPNAKLWSTTDPHLYDIEVTVGDDVVKSYFGMRKIENKKDAKGVNRFFLNNKPLFSFGPLDQGFWPDGIYTPPNEEAMKYDFDLMRKVGWNSIRKHVKVESERWYYMADKMGFVVWQDFPSANDQSEKARTTSDMHQLELEMQRMVHQLYNHPSIIMWVPFNEGWGQYDTPRIVSLFKSWDSSRLINEASGWNDHNSGDVRDHHSYPTPEEYSADTNRVVVTGEFGGVGLWSKVHAWDPENTKVMQYADVNTTAKMQKWYIDKLMVLRANAIFRISGGVYTQTTDVETEINGLVTYDREMEKFSDVTEIRSLTEKLYPSQSLAAVILPSGHMDADQEWHYVTKQPTGNWTHLDYDDASWSKGKSGFGTSGTPKVTIRTKWDTSDIWLRKTFDIPDGKLPKHPVLHIFYDDIGQVWINDVRIDNNKFDPYQVAYTAWDIDPKILKVGKNVIAIHDIQIFGGQGVDAGILDVCYDNC